MVLCPFLIATAKVLEDIMRRLSDLAIACTLLAITLPLLLVVWCAIEWDGTGPAFERRERIGRGGRRFPVLVFPTTLHHPGHPLPAWLPPETTPISFFPPLPPTHLPPLSL